MTQRRSDTAIDPLFLDRWSPRAYQPAPIPDADFETILEAGRWAPSAYNYQPWRFLYARRDDANWERFLSLLVEANRTWAANASALVFVISERTMGAPDKPNHTHSLDAGSAWAMMALQAHILGYPAHGMSGVDFDRATGALGLPDGWRAEMAFVVGRKAEPETLPEKLRARESPSDRRPIADTAFAGNFVR